MKKFGAFLAVGMTAVIIITIVIYNFLLGSSAEPPSNSENTQMVIAEPTVVPDIVAIQAALESSDAGRTELVGSARLQARASFRITFIDASTNIHRSHLDPSLEILPRYSCSPD